MNKKRVNLGCCFWKLDGFINVDIDPKYNPEVVSDVRSLPFEDNSIDELYAGHLFEHFSIEDSTALLTEWKRVLKPGGIITLTIPDFDKAYKEYCDGKIDQMQLGKIVFGSADGTPMEHKQVVTELILVKKMEEQFKNVKTLTIDECDYLVGKDTWQTIVTAVK